MGIQFAVRLSCYVILDKEKIAQWDHAQYEGDFEFLYTNNFTRSFSKIRLWPSSFLSGVRTIQYMTVQ